MATPDLPTVAEMAEITNTLHLLIIAMLGGAITIIGVVVAQAKIFIPRTLKRRDEQRKLELDKLRSDWENKHAADAVEIERERLLPQLVEQNRVMSNTTIALAQSFNTTMHQRTEQDAITSAALNANTKQLTANTERLDESTEKLEAVEAKVDRLYNRLTNVFPRDKSIDDLFGELKQVVATTKQVVDERKGDSKPIPAFTADIHLHPPTLSDDEQLKPTGTG